jgi:hypothetical protein
MVLKPNEPDVGIHPGARNLGCEIQLTRFCIPTPQTSHRLAQANSLSGKSQITEALPGRNKIRR